MKSLIKICMALTLLGFTQCKPSSHPSKWSDHELNEWMKSGQFLNGLQLTADPSIDAGSFALHYFNHKETWDNAFAFLKNTDFINIPLGRVELGDNMYATVNEYFTKDRDTTLMEAHKKYIDIQCVISGIEIIDITALENMTVTLPYDSEKDIEFGTVNEFTELKASSGRFFIFFPDLAHRPSLKDGNNSGLVRKIVVKVPVKT